MSEPTSEELPRAYLAWRKWAEDHSDGDGYYVQDGIELGYEAGRADELAQQQARYEALVKAVETVLFWARNTPSSMCLMGYHGADAEHSEKCGIGILVLALAALREERPG